MAKNIVFCADGTWNGPEDATGASVIDSDDEQEKVLLDASGNVLQTSKYLHGVGNSQNVAIKVLGGVFGAGLIARIVRGTPSFRAPISRATRFTSSVSAGVLTRLGHWAE